MCARHTNTSTCLARRVEVAPIHRDHIIRLARVRDVLRVAVGAVHRLAEREVAVGGHAHRVVPAPRDTHASDVFPTRFSLAEILVLADTIPQPAPLPWL